MNYFNGDKYDGAWVGFENSNIQITVLVVNCVSKISLWTQFMEKEFIIGQMGIVMKVVTYIYIYILLRKLLMVK